MSYTECVKNLEYIETDLLSVDESARDDRYLRMRLAEVYGCILCSDLTTDQCNELIDELHRIGSKVGFSLSRVSDIFYNSEW